MTIWWQIPTKTKRTCPPVVCNRILTVCKPVCPPDCWHHSKGRLFAQQMSPGCYCCQSQSSVEWNHLPPEYSHLSNSHFQFLKLWQVTIDRCFPNQNLRVCKCKHWMMYMIVFHTHAQYKVEVCLICWCCICCPYCTIIIQNIINSKAYYSLIKAWSSIWPFHLPNSFSWVFTLNITLHIQRQYPWQILKTDISKLW